MKKSFVITTLATFAIVLMMLLTVSIRGNKADQIRINATPEMKAWESRSSEYARYYPASTTPTCRPARAIKSMMCSKIVLPW